MVDWKKEIKLSDLVRRSKETPEPKPERRRLPEQPEHVNVEQTPFWKKEISFRRGPKEANAARSAEAAQTPSAQPAREAPKRGPKAAPTASVPSPEQETWPMAVVTDAPPNRTRPGEPRPVDGPRPGPARRLPRLRALSVPRPKL